MSSKSMEDKVEVVLSIVIYGHGCEDYLDPFPEDSEIGEYYRNNVRVYSTAAVPDISSIMATIDVRNIVNKINNKFKTISSSETKEIVNSIKDEMRVAYQESVIMSEEEQIFSDDPTFKRNTESRYLSQASNVIAYLANKEYWFYENHEDEVVSTPIQRFLHTNIGIHVTDIRKKFTHSNGEVTYETVIIPSSIKEVDLNLAYKNGVETVRDLLSNKLGMALDLSLESIFEIFGFEETQDKLKMISLVELHNFFKAFGIDYVNIFDLTCRTCKTHTLDEIEIANIGNTEFSVSKNLKAFGNRKTKKVKTYKKPRKQKKLKRTKNKKNKKVAH